MTIRIDKSVYLAAHGRSPRERGTWFFSPHRAPTSEQIANRDEVAVFHNLTFTEACRLARAAAPKGCACLYVLS